MKSIQSSHGDFDVLVRAAAFRLLLQTGLPITGQQLARAMGAETADVDAALARMLSAGRVRINEAGLVFGSAGLSVTKDRHEVELDGRRFWTWCAYDIIGIFGALNADGRALSPSPDGRTIKLRFENGRPVGNDAVLFRPDNELMSSCENVYREWCSNSNLFSDAREARIWMETHPISGRVMSLAEASDLARSEWAHLTG